MSDEVFAVYRRLFDYDARDLQARVDARDESRPDWIRERVSFTAAYGDERVIAQLYLPRTGRPPLVRPLESSARPMFQLLGTPPDSKVLRIYDSDHSVPRSGVIRESLAWHDRYLGPVDPAASESKH